MPMQDKYEKLILWKYDLIGYAFQQVLQFYLLISKTQIEYTFVAPLKLRKTINTKQREQQILENDMIWFKTDTN